VRVPVLVYREPTGGYSVVCPSLPGCHSQGETVEEALANVTEAITLYLEVLEEDGLPIPEATEPLVTSVEVERRVKVP
jgi:predicted RNase H-like HicB family nuclease